MPLVGVSRQPTMFMRVDLPEPDGPMTATYSPSTMRNETPARACTSSAPTRYVRCRSTSSRRTPTGGSLAAARVASARLLDVHSLTRLEVAKHLIRTGDHLLARLEIARNLDVGLARDPGRHLAELRAALDQDEHAGLVLDLGFVAP